MLFEHKSGLLSGLLIASFSLLAGLLSLNSACAETAVTPVSSIQLGLQFEPDYNFLATQSESQRGQGVWLSHNFSVSDNLQMSSASLSSKQFQTGISYADQSFSGMASSEAPVGGDKNSSVAYVPLPTTAWCFLIGVMTLLGMSKRRSAGRR